MQEVKIETLTGMKKYQASVALQNAQDAVISPKLTVGDVADQVTVLGNDIQLATYGALKVRV